MGAVVWALRRNRGHRHGAERGANELGMMQLGGPGWEWAWMGEQCWCAEAGVPDVPEECQQFAGRGQGVIIRA